MELHGPKNIMSYFDSLREFEDDMLPFAPMTYVTKKGYSINSVELLIGYTLDRKAVIINDNTISLVKQRNRISTCLVSKTGLEVHYMKVSRPTGIDSIFRLPKVGDTLMCVSKRYQGCTFGELYIVKEIIGDRLSFEYGAEYTYESQYFIVVGQKEKYITNSQSAAGSNITTGITVVNSRFIGNPYIEIKLDYDNPEKPMNFKILLDEDEVNQRTIKGVKLIRRPHIEDEEIIPRKYHVPEKIERIK